VRIPIPNPDKPEPTGIVFQNGSEIWHDADSQN
jgi:hypothetical protein